MSKVDIHKPQHKLVVFQDKDIRRTWYSGEWYYSLVDIVGALTDSINPTDYLKKTRRRDEELGFYIGTNCPQVAMKTSTGKSRNTLAGNTKDVFRLIQSVPSHKVGDSEYSSLSCCNADAECNRMCYIMKTHCIVRIA